MGAAGDEATLWRPTATGVAEEDDDTVSTGSTEGCGAVNARETPLAPSAAPPLAAPGGITCLLTPANPTPDGAGGPDGPVESTDRENGGYGASTLRDGDCT